MFQHFKSDKFEIFMLWKAISSVLRRQFMSKMFAIINCYFYAYYYFHGLLFKYLILFIFCVGFLNFLDNHFQQVYSGTLFGV